MLFRTLIINLLLHKSSNISCKFQLVRKIYMAWLSHRCSSFLQPIFEWPDDMVTYEYFLVYKAVRGVDDGTFSATLLSTISCKWDCIIHIWMKHIHIRLNVNLILRLWLYIHILGGFGSIFSPLRDCLPGNLFQWVLYTPSTPLLVWWGCFILHYRCGGMNFIWHVKVCLHFGGPFWCFHTKSSTLFFHFFVFTQYQSGRKMSIKFVLRRVICQFQHKIHKIPVSMVQYTRNGRTKIILFSYFLQKGYIEFKNQKLQFFFLLTPSLRTIFLNAYFRKANVILRIWNSFSIFLGVLFRVNYRNFLFNWSYE